MLARGYDHRPPSSAGVLRAARATEALRAAGPAVDVGGGRGLHAAVWAGQGRMSLVLDPSVEMTRSASGRQGVLAVRGAGQAMPFRSRSMALTFFHLSIHYGDWRGALNEATRVLEPGGRCVIWTLGRSHHDQSMLARWFPSVARIDGERFPEPALLGAFLGERSARVTVGREVETVRRRAVEWAAAVRGEFVSTLQLVGRDELRAGLQAFESEHPDGDEQIAYDMLWDVIVAEVD